MTDWLLVVLIAGAVTLVALWLDAAWQHWQAKWRDRCGCSMCRAGRDGDW